MNLDNELCAFIELNLIAGDYICAVGEFYSSDSSIDRFLAALIT